MGKELPCIYSLALAITTILLLLEENIQYVSCNCKNYFDYTILEPSEQELVVRLILEPLGKTLSGKNTKIL